MVLEKPYHSVAKTLGYVLSQQFAKSENKWKRDSKPKSSYLRLAALQKLPETFASLAIKGPEKLDGVRQ